MQNTVVIKDVMFAGGKLLCLYLSVSSQNDRNNLGIFFLNNFIYLFIFGCVGSLLLRVGFL